MNDERYLTAKQHADVIAVKIEELNTAIYEAHRYSGYHIALRVDNGALVGKHRYIGHGEIPVQLRATVNFDIGKAVL